MAYWLVKSEPSTYSWDQFEKDKQTTWDGIRNYAARNHLRAMKKGDEVFFYHSGTDPGIVGVAKVIKTAFPDPSADDDTWVAVELRAHKRLKKPVPLPVIKKEKALADMALIRISRLSVQPVTENEWKLISKLAETN